MRQRVFEALASDADNEDAIIDSAIVRARQRMVLGQRGDTSSEVAGGRFLRGFGARVLHPKSPSDTLAAKPSVAEGGLSTKIYALVDAFGNPVSFYLTPGQVCDLDGADILIEEMACDTLLADKGYDADERLIQRLEQ